MRGSALFLTLALCCGATACYESAEIGIPPPGTPGGDGGMLFYPIALATDPCGKNLYIANSNFDRAFTDGTLVGVPLALFDEAADAGTDGGVPPQIPFPTDPSTFTIGLLDTYASNMVVSPEVAPLADGGLVPCPNPASPPAARLYATTRNLITLSSAVIESDGGIACPMGTAGVQDCSSDAIILGPDDPHFVDPYAVTLARTTLPGGPGPQPVVLVSHLSQEPTNTDGQGLDTSMAVIPEPAFGTQPTTGPAESMLNGDSHASFSQISWLMDLGQPGSNSIVVGPDNFVVIGGCYLIVPGGTQEPCLDNTNNLTFYHLNPLRMLFLDSGPGGNLSTIGIGPLVGTALSAGGSITDMAKSTDGNSLYVAMGSSSMMDPGQGDLLLVMPFPMPSVAAPPTPTANIVLAYNPTRMVVLPRPQGDLIAFTFTYSNAVAVVDPNLATVVAQLQVGSQPFGITAVPVPLPTVGPPTMYRLFVAMFNDCEVYEIDVPVDAPEQTAIRSVIGTSCVQTNQQFVLFEGML